MTPKQIAELIQSISVDTVRESDVAARFGAKFTNDGDRNSFIGLLKNTPDFIEAITVYENDTDNVFGIEDLPNVGEAFRVDIKKFSFENELRLFLLRSISNNKASVSDFRAIRIAEIDDGQQFSTVSSNFLVWRNNEEFLPTEVDDLPDPRRFSVDFARPPEVPTDIRPWIVMEWPRKEGSLPSEWIEISSRRLMAALADRVSEVEGLIEYHFDGPPACSFALNNSQLTDIFPRLVAGAKFVFLNESRDADVRHLLLANEWARSYRKASLTDLGDNCVKSAATAYSAYIKAKSSEMLSALSALRKSVLEETEKISEKGHDFARSMWKDLAVAAAPFVIKVLSDAASANNSEIAKYLSFAAAAFLAVSLCIQWFLNERWLSSQEKARGIWRLEANTALNQAELKSIADDPIARSVFDYRAVGVFVTIFYIAIIVVLVQYGRGILTQ